MAQVNNPNLSPPAWEEEDVKADYGCLEQLAGTWVNYGPGDDSKLGMHCTMMPSAGTNADFVPAMFRYMADNYTEELTFKLVEGGVRNRGGYNEQYNGAIEYRQAIKTAPKEGEGKDIHVEDGMFLYMGNMYTHPLDEDTVKNDFSNIFHPNMKVGETTPSQQKFLPKYSICRSGTIPHGSTIHLLGRDYHAQDGAPEWPTGEKTWDQNHMAIDFSMYKGTHPIKCNLDEPRPSWVNNLPPVDQEYEVWQTHLKYVERIYSHGLYPYSVRPDLRLRDAIKGQNIKTHTFIDMGTRFSADPQGGVFNTPFVKKYCNVTEVQFRMWIETVVEDDGEEVLQLQYEQIVYMEFGYARDGSLTRWPHIQVNTLRKKDWVDANKAKRARLA